MKIYIYIVLLMTVSGCGQQNYNRISVSSINNVLYGAAYNSNSISENAWKGALRAVNCYPLHALCNPDLYK